MSDTMDSCHLVGLYRTTKTPGQLVLEPGLLTGAITACDLRGAPDSRSGLSTAGVPALSDPAKSRGLESVVREELAKVVRTVAVRALNPLSWSRWWAASAPP